MTLIKIWTSNIFEIINNYMLLKFHDRSFTVDSDLFFCFDKNENIENKKNGVVDIVTVVFRLNDLIFQLEKIAKSVKSLKLKKGDIQIWGYSEEFKAKNQMIPFETKINELEKTLREIFHFKKTFLAYRGDASLIVHNMKKKSFIKETFTSITADINTAKIFMANCCFYFLFIDPNVKVIPIYKYHSDESGLLLVPGSFYEYVSFGVFEIEKTPYQYYVYHVQPWDPRGDRLDYYSSGLTPADIKRRKKQLMNLIELSNVTNTKNCGEKKWWA
jgi:hypothetical protein